MPNLVDIACIIKEKINSDTFFSDNKIVPFSHSQQKKRKKNQQILLINYYENPVISL